jgi:hypothetical protein
VSVQPNTWTAVTEVGVEVMHDSSQIENAHVLYDSLHLPTTLTREGHRTPSWYVRAVGS